MSIQTALENLQQDITNARSAVVAKGGTTTTGGGSSQLATDIATIPTGITPTGNIPLTASTTTQTGIDVTNYATASVAPTPSESKTLTLGSSAPTTVTPTSGKLLSSVPVTLDTSIIKAENIAKDVQILGITGTHEGGGSASLKDISPVTLNGTYQVQSDLTIVDSMTLTGQAYCNTDITPPDNPTWSFEADFVVTTTVSGTDSNRLFGTQGTSVTNKFSFSQRSTYFNIIVDGVNYKCSVSPVVGTEYTAIFNGSSLTVNGTAGTRESGETGCTSPMTLDLFACHDNDDTHTDKFSGTFKYLKLGDYWFVPARKSDNTPVIYEKTFGKVYEITGTGVTLGSDVSTENYQGFASPLTVNVENLYNGASGEDLFPNTTTNHNIVFPDTSLTSNYQYDNMFSYNRGGLSTVSAPNLTSVDKTYAFAYFTNEGRIKSFTADAVTSVSGDHAFYNFAYKSSTFEKFSMKNLKTIGSGTYMFTYGFQASSNALANLTEVDFSSLETNNSTNTFNRAFQYQNKLYANKVAHPFPKLATLANNSGHFSYAWEYGRAIMYVFDKLPGISAKSSGASEWIYAFAYTTWDYRSGDTEGRKSGVAFPCVTQVGYSGSTAVNAACRYFMYSPKQGNGALYMPELETIYNNNTSSTYAHFQYCNAKYIYMPKLTAMGTKPEYTFYSSTNTTELHFGIENQATIEALTGYSSKFGATSATIYFDLANHLTINGGTYDRTGSKDDYDNWYMCFSDGTTDYYIDNFTGAVGDTVYTKSGDTYTATGYTVTAVS